jgi:hypothetical protein
MLTVSVQNVYVEKVDPWGFVVFAEASNNSGITGIYHFTNGQNKRMLFPTYASAFAFVQLIQDRGYIQENGWERLSTWVNEG